MSTWAVWTKVNGQSTSFIVVSGLTEKQANDVANHLRIYHGDVNVLIDED